MPTELPRGPKKALESLTGRELTGDNLDASLYEFAVVMQSGRIFYTGGFDDVESLRNALKNQAPELTGSYDPGSVPWVTVMLLGPVDAILDLRTDSDHDYA